MNDDERANSLGNKTYMDIIHGHLPAGRTHGKYRRRDPELLARIRRLFDDEQSLIRHKIECGEFLRTIAHQTDDSVSPPVFRPAHRRLG